MIDMISDAVMNEIYEKVKVPYKYGVILKSDNYFLDSPVVFRCENAWFMSCVCIDKKCSTGYYCAVNDKKERFIALAASTKIR